MRAILMAAGIGSRLSLNPDKPKCLWEIGEITLIENIVKLLKKNNIEINIVLGFKGEAIKEALKDYDVTYYCNPFFRATNSIASLWFAKDALNEDDDVILMNADVFFEQDTLDLLLENEEHDAVLLGDATRIETGDYFFKTDNGVLLAHGKELVLKERSCEYVGISKLKSTFIKEFKQNLETMIRDEKYHLWWENILYENKDKHPVYIKDVDGLFWGEIDYIQDYHRIKNYVESKVK